jgi:hypothetical protein
MDGKELLVAILLAVIVGAVIFGSAITSALGNRLTRSDDVGIKGVGKVLRDIGSGGIIASVLLVLGVLLGLLVAYALLPRPENYPPLI